ncbi:alpha-D-ribose 1-methylphosphonate 5-triphosphate diphosphatase [Jeotgalicoccus coquinae]|uniref:Alpha-D-ribose 1-methylphosphonate 5-triphosphate diphosphatase n=1 Tax=Jeotgalicoccus coquinae TaxID=709509 RepID=A0A6V7RR96_9STAP|nr:phosphonate metabolism protein PhnM [Jeotgalicoccus coquinae]MBB6424246.1 alpha-D-ribose 1-methylphosphonate 5-triphosphate diphosphatase [Jeotgalicoccus coquinae]GGE25310.1 alpha-D-ribose 1-methylphosphonate 5-triphosphate diphosphatase [Jeotgalicoccus coquinae]CAD2081591.1 Alpha-D-ribose 1-methylphosphonate 5-triphosphate diphosphatase [Jeotgalicoccus coquinae]
MIIINSSVITATEILNDYAVIVNGDTIEKLIPMSEVDTEDYDKVINAKGGYVTAGFIDIHSDYIEGIIAPRPTTIMDFNIGIKESERILSSHGITTMFHSLSIYKEDLFGHKPVRQPDNVDKLIHAIHRTHTEKHLIRHRMHARFELDSLEMIGTVKEHIKENRIHLLSFMDHTPGQGQYRDIENYRHTMKGYKDLSDEEINEQIEFKKELSRLSVEEMEEMSELARSKGIAVASHDDDATEKIDFNETLQTTISEFPITMEVAKYAHSKGMFTLAGAPNIMLGGSHSGNLNAKDAIMEGCISILCSDYYPAAMLHSVFKLHREADYPLVDAFKLITLNPAEAVKMDDEIGSIEPGKKADLNIIRLFDDYPTITECIVNGKVVSQYHYRID